MPLGCRLKEFFERGKCFKNAYLPELNGHFVVPALLPLKRPSLLANGFHSKLFMLYLLQLIIVNIFVKRLGSDPLI